MGYEKVKPQFLPLFYFLLGFFKSYMEQYLNEWFSFLVNKGVQEMNTR